jgi:hypothetical protein
MIALLCFFLTLSFPKMHSDGAIRIGLAR